MSALVSGLVTSSDSLRVLRVNDNWLKSGATVHLINLLLSAQKIEELDISDGNMGTVNVIAAIRALKSGSKLLRKFSCNYNDVESRKCARECLELLLALEHIKEIEFVGNVESHKLRGEFYERFEKRELKLDEEDFDPQESDIEESEDEVDLSELDELSERFE